MARSILDTLTLAATVVFAAPAALAGVFMITEGDPLTGVALLGVAALMVGLEEYAVSPTDLPVAAAKRVTGWVVETPDSEEE